MIGNSLSSTRRQAGAEYLVLDIGAQLHACPIESTGQRVPLPDPGIHTASAARLQHDGGRLVRFEHTEGRTIRVLFHACDVQKTSYSLLVVSLIRSTGVTLRTDTRTLFFPYKIQTQHSQTQVHKEESLFFVKGMLMAPLSTTGVSDDVAQDLQMPIGPQALEDVEEPMPSRPATFKDPDPDQIVLDQHSLTHFTSQPWCGEFRGRDSPHREQSNIDAVVPTSV